MDLADRAHLTGFGSRTALRIRALPALFKESIGLSLFRPTLIRLAPLRKLQPLLWLIAAVTLGLWAHDQARTEALTQWLRANPPDLRVWDHALGARGLEALRDPFRLQKAFRTLPASVDETSAVWTTPDLRWVAVFQAGDATQPGFVYCDECKRVPTGWEPAGTGWQAYEQLLPRLDAAIAARKKEHLPGRPRPYVDPREIRY